jgi:FKBP-type peptidyl-prolyl cis-trans isomerase (trigger factor)
MNENQTPQPTPDTEQVTPVSTSETPTSTPIPVTPEPKKSLAKLYVIAAIIVALVVTGVIYQLEKEERSSTNFFSSMIENQEANKVIATINGETILNKDLSTSIEQFNQVAVSQGIDTTSADVKAEIRSQALTVLINTTILKQEASKRGLSVTDEAVNERLETIKTELGGEEVLIARMTELGIDADKLEKDVKDEILIQQLLDGVFAENEIAVSEEEIISLYENAGGVEGGLPPFEEVRDQVAAEITATKEQEVIDIFLKELKDNSEIDIVNG